MQGEPRHRCLVYDGPPSAQLPGLAAITLQRLDQGYRCMMLNSPAMIAGFRSYLAAGGLDVAAEAESGALVLSSSQDHLTAGRFQPKRMLRLLHEAMEQALADGFLGLFATGDMLWEFGSEKNLEKLLEYELGLENLLRQNPAICGICQYHREVLPPNAVQVALYTHQGVYLNDTLSRVNPHYVKPGTLRIAPGEGAAGTVNELLESLKAKSTGVGD